MVNLDWGSLNR
ncbi:Protein of unknown function [Lactobacillus helveticus CIRM-BIA 101]|uniref:Uncharacterized protein n=3 Tax=Lactobacillus helveticus TaxID=1587 RepID=U4QMC8_LACHE|nr:Protein of unknown function [Lactobacillus helveticus CIRM-BIA 953]CDI57629.1 Protein of unknown function [Lactobacillus helveticus CIRM-BIA 951]CDI61655.1 Protein of unknown function [Lactobacillus helveticus CIRM-BIA 104]CDI61930.1 Protein of unknown function [Lactobacillus helveticus CIRM-BIA 103]CDI65100.1 Protein of unknown function [Lactobacillus helveticus CIRM-BIA 101]